ncbi:MAG: respiratory nitrate reductase subunit gamma [Candidatus Omnitrophica bacterium]|nr:respiratory nitrate reductase subunit gamma [Candidatus Omnitrophota bacterium]
MFDLFLFVGLPYLAIVSLVLGSILRFKMREFSYSSLSTQFLEDRWLAWASLPWHVGIIVVLMGHVLAFGFPSLWSALVSVPTFLLIVEAMGIFSAILCLFSLIIFLTRRIVDSKLQAVTSLLDMAVLLILFFQISSGIAVAMLHRWGAAWAPGALGPYLHSIFVFQPDASYLKDMPPLIKLHVALAWVLILFFPFTRLVHALLLPIHYIFRSPQKVVWGSSPSEIRFEQKIKIDNERRLFLKATLSLGASAVLLSLGALDKFLGYFLKQDVTEVEQAHLLSKKLQRLKQSAEERELELERMSHDSIFIAQLSELSKTKGKYFIDYVMWPALAFLDDNGFPILISAKCTHLGCTVGQDLDAQGRVLCPCHISYFDIKTGEPSLGSPAKSPLPHLGWALKDPQGKTLLVQHPDGKREGSIESSQLESSSLFILKRFS